MAPNKELLGQTIRELVTRIEELKPELKPYLPGIENPGGPGDRPRARFQDAMVTGWDNILMHARGALTMITAELRARAEADGTVAYAAGEVELGWTLRYDGADRVVADRSVKPPRRDDETERRVALYFKDGHQARGDEGATVYRVIDWSRYL